MNESLPEWDLVSWSLIGSIVILRHLRHVKLGGDTTFLRNYLSQQLSSNNI